MSYANQQCVEACSDCISTAAYCSYACIDEGMEKCAKQCLECVDICRVMAVFAARDSMHMQSVAQACIEICEACAAECDNHDNDHCRDCAVACRECAEKCRVLTRPS